MDGLRSFTRRMGYAASVANGAMLTAERDTHVRCLSEVGLKPIAPASVPLVAKVLEALRAKTITEEQAKSLIRKL